MPSLYSFIYQIQILEYISEKYFFFFCPQKLFLKLLGTPIGNYPKREPLIKNIKIWCQKNSWKLKRQEVMSVEGKNVRKKRVGVGGMHIKKY
tara:strand:- start:41117 stop:41392 length:276 start_codon:yes stop_codon:yes gene_type:complete